MHWMHQSVSAYFHSSREVDSGELLSNCLEALNQRREIDLSRCVLVADYNDRFALRTLKIS